MPRALLIAIASLAACGGPAPSTIEQHYLDDAEFRHRELAASFVNPANGYSRRRLENYVAWESLPAWNPRVDGTELVIDEAASAGDRAALVALGARAFLAYPAQSIPASVPPIDPARYGAEHLVSVAMADGTSRIGYTCATCHSSHGVMGLGNAEIDIGLLFADAVHDTQSPMRAWGPGRADVSTIAKTEPVRIPDLRATRFETHLQVNATVAQRSIASLALRIETLIITGHGEIVRPPREVALGMALYLWSLAPPIPRVEPPPSFVAACGHCHANDTLGGPPTPIAAIGIDAVARSSDRGTGTFRTPSLVGVRDRALLLHDGSIHGLDALLDPARTSPMHRYGLDLEAPARAELLAYLAAL